MSKTITIVAVPGVQINQPLPATSKVAVVDIGNGTPFDLTYNGFGCPDSMVIEAGLKVRLYHEVLDTGQMSILPVNNVGVTGTGIINVTAYFINETIPKGTFPVSIPTQIVQAKVSSVITLSNEGGAVGTEVIDIGDVNFAKLVDIFNDGHFVWSVDQSNVKHQVLKANTSGNPLQIGQAADISEVLGNLTVDGNTIHTGTTTLTGNTTESGTLAVVGITTLDNGLISTDGAGRVTIPNGVSYRGKDNGGVARPIVYVDSTNGSNLQAAATNGIVFIDEVDGTTTATFSRASGLILLNPAKLGIASAADMVDASVANTIYYKVPGSSTAALMNFQVPNGTTVATFKNTVIQNLVQLVQDSGSQSVVNGSVAGNVTFYAPIWGTGLKVLIVVVNGFNSASVATFNFPTNLVSGVGFMGDLGASTTWGLFNSGVAQSLAQVSGASPLGAAGAAGSSTGETALHGNNLVWFRGITGTQIQIGTTGGAVLSAAGIIIGV